MMNNAVLELAPPSQLAVAYAFARVRPAFKLMLEIDRRFADILRNAREPMIAQIKMAWWREAFAKAPAQRPKGEPLLQALNQTDDLIPFTATEALALAWEKLLGSDIWTQEVVESHAIQRAEAIFQTYAQWVERAQDMGPLGQFWAMETLRLDFPDRVSQSIALPMVSMPKSRALRPLSILTMSVRTASGPRLVWHALTGL